MDIIVLHGLLEVLFNKILYRGINGRHDIAAVLAGTKFLEAGVKHFRPIGIGRAYRLSLSAGKRLLIPCFNALEAVIVRADEADKMAGKRGVGVITLYIRLKPDAVQVVFQLELADPIRGLAFDLSRDGHIPRAASGRFLQYIIIVKPKYLG